MNRKKIFKLHRWIGLTAAIWLFTLGITGILLDHDEWRWLRQTEVPKNWLSSATLRYLPATVMRYVVVDQNNTNNWIGGSERGLWLTKDKGTSWSKLSFPNDRNPQIMRFAKLDAADKQTTIIATDDGLWIMDSFGSRIKRLALAGRYINMISPGSTPNEIIGVENFETIFKLKFDNPSNIEIIDISEAEITGLPNEVSMYKFLFDLHFGYGLYSRNISTWINDFGGIALMILSFTGFLSWYLQRKWRKNKPLPSTSERRSSIIKLIYRSHAPIIGIIAIVPILYLSITGILFNHIYAFINWGEKIDIERSNLPYVWRYETLKGEIDQIITYPDQPQKMSISTRYGILDTLDGGLNWEANTSTGSERGQLFRTGDHVFYSNNSRQFFTKKDGDTKWSSMKGIPTIVYDAEFLNSGLMLKNSRGFFRDKGGYNFEIDAMKHPELNSATLYLFMIEIHTGNAIHPQFKWISDLFTIMGIIMVVTGPILWWRRKW